jgi:hypothetical protein
MRALKTTFVAAATVASTFGLCGVASATTSNPYVTVTHDNGGTQVGTGVPGQPLASVSADNNGVCFGFSYEEGSCIPVRTG